MSLCMSISLTVCLSFYLFLCLLVCLTVFVSLCPSVSLSLSLVLCFSLSLSPSLSFSLHPHLHSGFTSNLVDPQATPQATVNCGPHPRRIVVIVLVGVALISVFVSVFCVHTSTVRGWKFHQKLPAAWAFSSFRLPLLLPLVHSPSCSCCSTDIRHQTSDMAIKFVRNS